MPVRCRNALVHFRSVQKHLEKGTSHARFISDVQQRPDANPTSQQLVFSGIQPTGIPHLGNYLGALRPWVKLQNEGTSKSKRCVFCVVDLHALTVPQNALQLTQWRKESYASLLAVGLDYKKSTIFLQSDVSMSIALIGCCLQVEQIPAHAELMWILSTVASTGQLSRMTQWKVPKPTTGA